MSSVFDAMPLYGTRAGLLSWRSGLRPRAPNRPTA
jgi:hypothetical protein